MSELLAYTAGLIDGEGTVTLSRIHKRSRRTPVVSVSSTSRELMDFLQGNFGGSVVNHRTHKDHHKPSWMWKLDHRRAMRFLEQIFPHMKEKEKLRRIRLILDDYLKVTPRNGYYTPELEEAKKRFEEEFFRFSGAGGN